MRPVRAESLPKSLLSTCFVDSAGGAAGTFVRKTCWKLAGSTCRINYAGL